MNATLFDEAVTVSDFRLPTEMTTAQLVIEYTLLTLCTVTVIINPITLTAMVKSKLVMVSSINVFITSLCFSDLLVGMSVFVYHFPLISLADDINQKRVKFFAGVGCVTSFMISNINGFHITLDRTLATLCPHKYKAKMTAKKATVAVVVTWVGSTVFLSTASAVNTFFNGGLGDIDYPDQVLPEPLMTYFTTQLLMVGMLANVILYVVIVRSLVKSSQKVHSRRNSLSDKRSIQMTRMVVIVIGVMLLGNLPIVVMAAIPIPPEQPDYIGSHRMAYDLALCVGVVPTFINNVIYVGRMTDFRKSIRNLLCCQRVYAHSSSSQNEAS